MATHYSSERNPAKSQSSFSGFESPGAPEELFEEDAVRGTGRPFYRERVTDLIVEQRVLLGHEQTRTFVTLSLIALYGTIIIIAGLHTGSDEWDRVKDWLHIALLALSPILGIALGFYFVSVFSTTRRR